MPVRLSAFQAHRWEWWKRTSCDVLMPINSVAERSNTPTSKFVIITVSPSASQGRFDYDHVEQEQPMACA
jgi:hypothetical protein